MHLKDILRAIGAIIAAALLAAVLQGAAATLFGLHP